MNNTNHDLPLLKMRRSLWAFWNLWLVAAIGVIFVGMAGFIADLILDHVEIEMPDKMILGIQGVGAAIIAYSFIQILYMRYYSTYTVYTDRMEVSHGIFSKSVSSIYMEHIRSVDVKKTLAGMILGYGNLFIGTSGTGDNNITMLDIEEPMLTKKTILEIRDGEYVNSDGVKIGDAREDNQKKKSTSKMENADSFIDHTPFISANFNKVDSDVNLSASFNKGNSVKPLVSSRNSDYTDESNLKTDQKKTQESYEPRSSLMDWPKGSDQDEDNFDISDDENAIIPERAQNFFEQLDQRVSMAAMASSSETYASQRDDRAYDSRNSDNSVSGNKTHSHSSASHSDSGYSSGSSGSSSPSE